MEVFPGEMTGMSLTDSALEKRSCVQFASNQTNPFEKNLVAIQAKLQVHLCSF
jgi:hypothetical protein